MKFWNSFKANERVEHTLLSKREFPASPFYFLSLVFEDTALKWAIVNAWKFCTYISINKYISIKDKYLYFKLFITTWYIYDLWERHLSIGCRRTSDFMIWHEHIIKMKISPTTITRHAYMHPILSKRQGCYATVPTLVHNGKGIIDVFYTYIRSTEVSGNAALYLT